jgi:hypothetical protein
MLQIFITIGIFILLVILVFALLKKLTSPSSRSASTSNGNSTAQSTSRDREDSDEMLINPVTNQQPINRQQQSNQQSQSQYADPNKKITKKEQYKMEKKKMKEDNREYQKQLLEARKLRDQEKEKDYLEKEMKREEDRKKEEEILQKLKEDQQRKENDVYNQWKGGFAVAEEGEEQVDFDSEDLINDFINYIKLRKVVSLEDLSGVFKIPAGEVVERLKALESQNRICGIVDDRGKYICLTEKELQAIENIFMKKGRISKADLIKECNKIIRFQPTEEDKQKILEEQNKIFKTFEEEFNKKETTK